MSELFKNLVKIAYLNPKYRKELFILIGVKQTYTHYMRVAETNTVDKIKEEAKQGKFSGYTLGVLTEYYTSKNRKFRNPNPDGGKDEIAMSTLVKYYNEAQENPEYNKFLGQTTSEIQRAFDEFYNEFERQQQNNEVEDEEEESDDEVVDEGDLRNSLKESGISEALLGLKDEQIQEIGSLIDEINDPENLGVNTEEFYSLAERMMYEVGDDEVWLNCGLKDTPEGLAQMEAYLKDLGFDPKKVFNESGLNEMGFFERNLDFKSAFTRPMADLIKKQTNGYERSIDLYGNKLFGGAVKMIKAVSGKNLDKDTAFDSITQAQYMQYLAKKFSTKPVNMEEIMKSYHDDLKTKIKNDELFDKVYEQLKKSNFSTVQTMLRKDRLEKLGSLNLDRKHKEALDELIAKGAFTKARKYIDDKNIFSASLDSFIDNQVSLKDTIKKLTQEYYEKEDIGINPEMRRQIGKNTYTLMGLVKKGFANEISEQSTDKLKDYLKSKITAFNPNAIPTDYVQNHLTNLNEYNRQVLKYAKKGAKEAAIASFGDVGNKINEKTAGLIMNKLDPYFKDILQKKGADYLKNKMGPLLKEHLGFDDEKIKEFFSTEKGVENSMAMLRKAIEFKMDKFTKGHEDTVLKFMGDHGAKIDMLLSKSTELTDELKEQVKNLKPEQMRDFLKEKSEKALKEAFDMRMNFDDLQREQIQEALKANKKFLFELIPDKDELDSMTQNLGSELKKELDPLYDEFKSSAIQQIETLKKDILKEATTISADLEQQVSEKTKELLEKNYEIADIIVKGDAGKYLKATFDKTNHIMQNTELQAKKLNNITNLMVEVYNSKTATPEAKAESIKHLNGLLAETKKDLVENIKVLKLGNIPKELKEKGFGYVDGEKLLKNYKPSINEYEKKILDHLSSADSVLKNVHEKLKDTTEFINSTKLGFITDFKDLDSLVKEGVGKLNSSLETEVHEITHNLREEGLKMLSEKLDTITPKDSEKAFDRLKYEAETLLKNKVETLKQQLVDSKEYASDEIDKMIEDAEYAKEKAIKTFNEKLDQGFDKVLENKKELLGGLQITSDSIKRLHESVNLKDPKEFLHDLKMQKVEMLDNAQSSATHFLKDKFQGILENASIDTKDPSAAASLITTGLGATLNMAGGAVMGLVSNFAMSRLMQKSFYKQIEDKHGKKEVLIQEMLSGSMTPVKLDKQYRKEHDKIMNDTNMSPSKREQELFKLRIKYEDQVRPAIARALYLMGERDESGEKVKGTMNQMFEFMKRASNDDFNYASFYLVASDDDDEQIPFYMQIKLDIVKTQYQKEMKKHTEDLFSGKKNKEIFEYMTGKKSIPRKYYDQVKKEHIEKAHQISNEYKKKKNSKLK